MIIKQPIDISFARGLDTKTDPKRVPIGNFASLENSVFQKGGLLQKRNGYKALASLPDTTYGYVTTLNGNLTAIGPTIAAYDAPNVAWVSRGTITPLAIDTLPLIRNNFNQTQCDAAVAPNGLVCVTYVENNGTSSYLRYAIADSTTGQNIVLPSPIPVSSGTVSGPVRVYVMQGRFVLLFTNTISAIAHLQYVTINYTNPTLIGPNLDIAPSYEAASGGSFDAAVVNDNLYIAYPTTVPSQNVEITSLNLERVVPVASPRIFSGENATLMSVSVDTTPLDPIIYLSYYNSGTTRVAAVDQNLFIKFTPVTALTAVTVLNITGAAQDGVLALFVEVQNNYGYDASIPTHYVGAVAVTNLGAVGTPFISARSVGLASKAFIVNSMVYYLAAYQSAYQPTYFLINGEVSTSANPVVAAKLAYQNGGGYITTGLPNVTLTGDIMQVPYLFKDLITAVNKDTNVTTGTQVNGIYSQTGINLASMTFSNAMLDTSEIANDLHISGGFLWMYDGYFPVEHNFFLYPDNVEGSWSATGGAMQAQPDGITNTDAYFYQVVYEWTDNTGNAFRSAPSIPLAITTTGNGTTGSVVLDIPTLRLTFKTQTPVKITIYRWSVAQQAYYEVTSITQPLLNDPTIDYVTYTDTLADATILGNALIYTTGGVVEDVNAPGTNLMTLFDTRLWLVDAEDQNLLWFSKQVIEATPVEMSDLFTMFIPPTVATATGVITAIYPMDDKLIISKGGNSFVYINGAGPDNTGANNQYSQPIFITSTVGCQNQKSLALMPMGLMFESNKGIWLLGRDLSTTYIGAPVESFTTGNSVLSAQVIPETNQVRFVMSSGVVLMYDYYYAQWGTFTGVPSVSSCIYQNKHTFINAAGATYQESDGYYQDGSEPVLMQFTTGPIKLGNFQSYQRAYYFYLLGDYVSPHILNVSVSYDYGLEASSVVIRPTNFSMPYGSGSSQSPYGEGSPYGGPRSLETWRVFLSRQRCEAIAISLQEFYDATLGTAPGAGFTLSGVSVLCGFKSPMRPQPNVNSVGAS